MNPKLSPLSTAIACALSLTLSGCGGGGGSDAPLTFNIPGTAATGAPYPADSVVTVTDAGGATYTGKVEDALGNYSVTVSQSARAPFVVTVSAEDLPTLVSVSTDTQPARINVTPITNLIAATLSPSGDPQKLAGEIKSSSTTITADSLRIKKDEVIANILKPVTDALSDTTDPISGTIEIGKGHDLVLEALKIQVQPTSTNTSTVSVSLKSANPVDMAPITLGSTTNGGVSSLPKLAEASGYTAPAKSDLAGEGLPNQIAALLSRISACYALPVAERIKTDGALAADITADACKSIFLGNDPAKYLHNSYGVSKTSAFRGIFSSSDAARAVKYSLPAFEYKVKNGNSSDTTKPMDGDVVFTARWIDGDGNSNVDEYWARPDATGKLFLTGNLSNLDIEVSPRAEYREFLNLSGKDFYSTGYNIVIHAKHSYEKIIATSPRGTPVTLVKRSGLDFYVITKNGVATTTSVVRLAGSYKDSASSTPRGDFASLVWAGDKDLSDAELAAIPLQGTWTFDLYTKASDTEAAVKGVKRRTLQRPYSLAELKAAKWPTLVDAVRADGTNASKQNGYITLDDPVTDNKIYFDNDDKDAWSVPTGAWSPTRLIAFGFDPTTALSFNDLTNFRSTERKAVVRCAASGAADKHCADGNGNYASNMQISMFTLRGRDQRRVQMNYSMDLRK
jgi:hypothetical protein